MDQELRTRCKKGGACWKLDCRTRALGGQDLCRHVPFSAEEDETFSLFVFGLFARYDRTRVAKQLLLLFENVVPAMVVVGAVRICEWRFRLGPVLHARCQRGWGTERVFPALYDPWDLGGRISALPESVRFVVRLNRCEARSDWTVASGTAIGSDARGLLERALEVSRGDLSKFVLHQP